MSLTVVLTAGAVSASPLYRRQDSTLSVTSTDAVSQQSSTAIATATATQTTTEAAATTPGQAPSASSIIIAGDAYPLYPCPMGDSLTYEQGNRTLGQPIDQTNSAVGEWATASFFPNITESEGGSTIGATHTWNDMGIPYPETLVNTTMEGGSAYTQYVYNSTAPVTVNGTTISQYQAVYKAYDPTYPGTGERGPSTLVQIFINACANDQDAARPLLQDIISTQLGLVSGNDTSNGGTLVTSVLSTDSLTATATNTAVATETNTDVASTTVLATASDEATQTNTVIPAVTSVVATTDQVTTTAATEQVTTTPLTNTATTTAVTETSTAATVAVTSDVSVETVATTTTAT